MAVRDYFKQVAQGFRHAGRGVVYIIRMERNARIHLLAAIVVLFLSWYFGLSGAEQAAIFFAVVIVFLAEIMNTALEKTLDLIDQNHNEHIRLIKDMAAGAVLVASVAAMIIGLAIFWPYFLEVLWQRP